MWGWRFIEDVLNTRPLRYLQNRGLVLTFIYFLFQIKNHLWVFVNCLIVNPTFDSQTKENMTLQAKSFGSKCAFSEKFTTSVMKCGVVEAVMAWARFKQQAQLQSKCASKKHNKIKGKNTLALGAGITSSNIGKTCSTYFLTLLLYPQSCSDILIWILLISLFHSLNCITACSQHFIYCPGVGLTGLMKPAVVLSQVMIMMAIKIRKALHCYVFSRYPQVGRC